MLCVPTHPLPQAASFLHMHLGIDAAGLSPDLDCHHLVVNDWSDLEAPLNVCIARWVSLSDSLIAEVCVAWVSTWWSAIGLTLRHPSTCAGEFC